MNAVLVEPRSIATTEGIRISVQARFLPEQSVPSRGRYVFAYTIEIRNVGTEAAQLHTRHWIISDGRGGIEEVRGEGVVGEQPHLDPGEAFQYTSGCVLATAVGSMHGTYQMVRNNGARFDAAIAPFALAAQLDAGDGPDDAN